MATWPSGTKASTANLDAGTDKPSLARADIKQNVDNVNSIIDMFNISAPSDGQILKYNTSNTRFELATDSTGAGGITSVTAGTGISVDQTSEGGVTITNTVTDTNTTYSISAVTDGSDANIRLTGSDASTDDIQLVAGSNITLTVNSAGGITVAVDTTPDLGTPSAGNLTNCTVDGTNTIGYRDLPAVGTKTTSYTLQTADIGKYVQVGSGGSITIPDATFAEGDALVIANNHSAAITITCSITTAYIAGTDADKASVSLATRGVATVLFLSGTVCIISGNVS